MKSNAVYISQNVQEPLVKALGLEVACYDENSSFEQWFNDLAKRYQLIYINELNYKKYQEILETVDRDKVTVTVLSLSGSIGNTAKRRMKRLLEDAIGISSKDY